MQLIPKWRVTVLFEDRRAVEVWIADSFISNVLRKVADIDFAEFGTPQPVKFTIEPAKSPANPTVTSVTSGGIGQAVDGLGHPFVAR